MEKIPTFHTSMNSWQGRHSNCSKYKLVVFKLWFCFSPFLFSEDIIAMTKAKWMMLSSSELHWAVFFLWMQVQALLFHSAVEKRRELGENVPQIKARKAREISDAWTFRKYFNWFFEFFKWAWRVTWVSGPLSALLAAGEAGFGWAEPSSVGHSHAEPFIASPEQSRAVCGWNKYRLLPRSITHPWALCQPLWGAVPRPCQHCSDWHREGRLSLPSWGGLNKTSVWH